MDIQSLLEAKQVGSAFLVTGAFNPYTLGHEEVARQAAKHASEHGYTHFYHGLGASENAPTAPLSFKQKEKIVTASHSHIKAGMPKTKMKFGIVPHEASITPFHQIIHMIETGGHKHITVALGPDQFKGAGSVWDQIQRHINTHGGMLGSDKKTVHKVKIDLHKLAEKRDETDRSAAELRKIIVNGRIPVEHAKAGRIRKFVMSGDHDVVHAMMPESVHAKKGGPEAYTTMIKKQITDVVPAAEEARRLKRNEEARKRNAAKKKNITECFSVDAINEFVEILSEAQIVRSVINKRKAKLQFEIQKAKVAGRKQPPQIKDAYIKNARFSVANDFARRILAAKLAEVRAGLDTPPKRTATPPKTYPVFENTEASSESQTNNLINSQQIMNTKNLKESFVNAFMENLNEARRDKVASPSKVRKKVRTEIRAAAHGAGRKKKDAIRKQEDRREERKKTKFAVVLAGKKIKIVQKQDIGKSKIILSPEKFDKAKAKRYLDDPTFEITDSSKKLFPEFKRKKAEAKPKTKKRAEQTKKGKKSNKQQAPKVTNKPPREVLPQLPETPKGGRQKTTQKSQYPDWNHNATDLEEAIPTIFNAMVKIKTGSEDQGATELLKTSQTLAPSTQRAVRQIMGLVVPQIGDCVAIHMGKQNDGKPTKAWITSGGANATSKSDIVFVPKKLWQQAKGKTLSEKLKSIDASKCIRASMKCGASQIVNGEAGEAMATIDAANMIAGDIAAKNKKVAKLIKEAKDVISKFAKSAETGQYEVGEIRDYIESGQEPKDKAFRQAKRIVEEQDKVQKLAAAKLVEIYNESPEFMEAFIYEGARGGVKHGEKSIRCATHMISMNKDGTDVKLQLIDMKLVRKLKPAIKFRCRFKPRSKMVKGVGKVRTLSSAFNVDLRSIQEEVEQPIDPQQQQQQPQINFSGSSSRVDEDLKMIGDNVTALTNYVEIEPDLVTTNEVDVGDYMEGAARDYNEIIIDGQTHIMIPVQDYQSFENIKQELGEETYEFMNDFIVENIDNQDAVDMMLTSGLISEQTIHNITNKTNSYSDLLNEMLETGLLRPDLLENFIEEARDYKKEYKEYHSKPKQRANRSKRVLARRKLMKSGRVRKGDGKDVHHKDGNPQNNSTKNLKVTSIKYNRGLKEEHGAGEIGTDELRKKYIKDTPFSTDPIDILKKVVKHGIKHK
jgi:nicotinic acid mononucleotide adenylyltransferase